MDPSNSRMLLAQVAMLLLLLICELASLRPETKNRFHLDRLECTILKPKIVKSVRCASKHISMSNLKIDIEANATRPIQSIWVHALLYHKFNGVLYSKLPIDIWENVCAFFNGKRDRTFFLNWALARLQPFSNFNHSCPYSNLVVKADNISMDEVFSFSKEILPFGRYRVNIFVTEEDHVPILEIKFFGTNSEY